MRRGRQFCQCRPLCQPLCRPCAARRRRLSLHRPSSRRRRRASGLPGRGRPCARRRASGLPGRGRPLPNCQDVGRIPRARNRRIQPGRREPLVLAHRRPCDRRLPPARDRRLPGRLGPCARLFGLCTAALPPPPTPCAARAVHGSAPRPACFMPFGRRSGKAAGAAGNRRPPAAGPTCAGCGCPTGGAEGSPSARGGGPACRYFPDGSGSGTETGMRGQIGNAVPPMLARALALGVAACMKV